MTQSPNQKPAFRRTAAGIVFPMSTLLTLLVLAAVSIFGCDTPGLRPNPPRSRLDIGNEAPRPKQPRDSSAKANGRSGTTRPHRSGTTNPRRSGTTIPRRSGTTNPRRSGTTIPGRSFRK